MRKVLYLVVAFLLAACGSTEQNPLYSTVQISIGGEASETHSSVIPEEVVLIKLVVEAPDMVTIEEEFEILDHSRGFQTYITVPKGRARRFIALAIDNEGYIIYKGDTVVDIYESEVSIVIRMKEVNPTPLIYN